MREWERTNWDRNKTKSIQVTSIQCVLWIYNISSSQKEKIVKHLSACYRNCIHYSEKKTIAHRRQKYDNTQHCVEFTLNMKISSYFLFRFSSFLLVNICRPFSIVTTEISTHTTIKSIQKVIYLYIMKERFWDNFVNTQVELHNKIMKAERELNCFFFFLY